FNQISIGNLCNSGWPTWKGPRLSAHKGLSYGGRAAAWPEIGRFPRLALGAYFVVCAFIRPGSEPRMKFPEPAGLSKYPSARSCEYAFSTGRREMRRLRASERVDNTTSPARRPPQMILLRKQS